jgi:hypothetical protein
MVRKSWTQTAAAAAAALILAFNVAVKYMGTYETGTST